MSKHSRPVRHSVAPPPERSWLHRPVTAGLFAGGILLLAAALRVYDVGGPDLWVDEANSVLIARQSPGEIVAQLRLDSSPPLYYFVLHVWMGAFGASESALRALSITGSVALIGAVLLVGRRLFGPQVGFVAALLLAVSSIQVFYSQQVRMYTWLSTLALLSSYALWRAISEGRARYVVVYGLSTLAALYLHNAALYLLPAHLVVLLWSGALRRQPLPWLLCGVGIALGYLPWLPTFLAQLGNKGQYSWFIPFWNELGPGGVVLQTLKSFAPGGRPLYAGQSTPMPGGWLATVLFTGVAALSLTRLLRPKRAGTGLRGSVGWLVSIVFIPLGCALATSSLLTPNYVPGRTDQLVFPGFVLLVAVGLSVVRPLILRYALVTSIVVLSLVGLGLDYGRQRPASDRALSRAIANRAQPGDAVLTTSLTRASLEYYLGRSAAPVTFYSYPRDTAHHLGNQDDAAWRDDAEKLRVELRLVQREIRAPDAPVRRVFVVVVLTRVNELLHKELIESQPADAITPLGQFKQAGTGFSVVAYLLQF